MLLTGHVKGRTASPKTAVAKYNTDYHPVLSFLLEATVFWGSTDSNFFFQSWERLILNFVEHSQILTLESEKLSGGVWSESVLKTNLKKSTCLPYEQKSLINIPTKTFLVRT